ncbi:hypothetical protein [Parafrankia soli]|nr:hypothetical protein [Parafrankia soli]
MDSTPPSLVDLARFGTGMSVFGYVNSALVWVFVHQLGYFCARR